MRVNLPPNSPVSVDPSSGRRFHELDAVRGIASMSVVLLHFHDFWISNTSTHLAIWKRVTLLFLAPLYAGQEAVILFFVLSGFVLSLPYHRGRQQPYFRYLIRRILRIYGPYGFALVLGIAGAAFWHHYPYYSQWGRGAWSVPVNFTLVEQHIVFLGAYDWTRYDFVIWSLIYEIRISIIFPLLILVTVWLGVPGSLLFGLLLSSTVLVLIPNVCYLDLSAWYSFISTLHYIAFFLIGIVLSSRLGSFRRWWMVSSRAGHWAVALGSIIGYTYGQIIVMIVVTHMQHHPAKLLTWIVIIAQWINAIGAAGIIIVSLNATLVQRLLSSGPARFFGQISYSLYLIHPIVLLTLIYISAGRLPIWLLFIVYVLFAPLLAWIFCVAVEERFILWSRAV
jgi:peptidoglycan/LPS O-acetylase OafA/YrhL